MQRTELRAYHELQAYTLGHGDPAFLHQHVVDAWTAQKAGPDTKPMALTFALIGLYLHVEKGWTGRQVQRAHMVLARRKRRWPALALPARRGDVRAQDVLAAAAGAERDRAIDAWCAAVWTAFRGNRRALVELLEREGLL